MPTRRTSSRGGTMGMPQRESEEDRITSTGRRSALIQLKFGRAAHLLSAVAAVMLAVAAVIAFMITSWDWLISDPQPLLDALVQFIPLLTAAAIAVVIIYLKWDPFLTDKTSKHFITSFAALAVPLIMIVLVLLKWMRYADIANNLWIYPASFVGISLSLISITMIWDGMSRRKVVAIASALTPLIIMSFTLLTNQVGINSMLPLVYLGSAVCIQLSGSMMHLIATSTSVQEREILKAGDQKIIQIRDDAQRIKDQLDYKERALMEREIAFEGGERGLSDLKMDLDQRKRIIEIQEEEQSKREMLLREEREKVSAAVVGMSHREEKLQQREVELASREKELEAITLALQSKEEQLRIQTDQTQVDQTSLKVAEKQFKERQELIHEELANLKNSREALLSEQKKLAEKERNLKLKESSLEMKMRSAESSKASSHDTGRLKQWEEKLLKKEEELTAAESELKDRMRGPEQLMAQADLKMKSAEDRIKDVEEKEKGLLTREAAAERLENEIISGREDLQQKMMEIDTLRQEAASKKQRYDIMIEALAKRTAEIAKREDMIRAGSTTMETRERSVSASIERLQREKQEIEAQRRSLTELEKNISAKSSQLQMREVEMIERRKDIEAAMRSGAAAPEAPPGLLEDINQRGRALDLREKMIAEKERDLRKRAYASTKGEEGAEEAPATAASSRIGTGTKRLDDLLMGGLPPGSNALFVGPPYTGKEVGILAFLAEGLKRGIPAIIVTTSKTPNDIVKDFAPILPTLLEVEHLGLVRWIDATSGEAQKDQQQGQRKNYAKVDGADDFPGIIEAVERYTDDIRHGHYPYFKLGYLSLSTSISHTNENESTKFIQAITRSVKDLGSSAIFAIEKGMHTEQQIETIQHLTDGAIMIKLEKQKTYLSVLGIGEVQSREWIEFKHTSAGLIIGAFSLERIR